MDICLRSTFMTTKRPKVRTELSKSVLTFYHQFTQISFNPFKELKIYFFNFSQF